MLNELMQERHVPALPRGLDCPDRPAEAGEAFLNGDLGYPMRPGRHYFSRRDWHQLMRFVKLHSEETA